MSHQPDNIVAGTQVIVLVEVRGTNNSLIRWRDTFYPLDTLRAGIVR